MQATSPEHVHELWTRAFVAHELAVLFSRWQLAGTGPDGKEVRMSGVTADVVRRQAGGGWLMVIDNPFGGSQVMTRR